MKSRRLLIVILVIACIAVYYVLGTGYLDQSRENTSLVDRIAAATETLAQTPLPSQGLGDELDAARADLDAARSEIPAQLNSTRIIDDILRLAEEIDVKAIPLITQPWTVEDRYGSRYSVFRLNVNVTGTFTRLTDFTGRLETGEPDTLVIEYLSVERGDITEDTPEDEIPVSASIDIVLFSQAPAAIEIEEIVE